MNFELKDDDILGCDVGFGKLHEIIKEKNQINTSVEVEMKENSTKNIQDDSQIEILNNTSITTRNENFKESSIDKNSSHKFKNI